MITKINLQTAIIPYNYVLVKCDQHNDFHEIPTPDGKVTIQLSYFNQDKSKYLSISGTVLMLPRETWFFANKGDGTGDEFNAMVRNSLEFDAPFDAKVGERIFFDYREQIDTETECRLVRTDEHGLCVLVRQDRIYGVYRGDDLHPVNGYVFFLRDQLPDKLELSSGILLVREHDKYEMNTATVIAADEPCIAHLEKEHEPDTSLQKGDRIILMRKRGFRVSYEVGNEELRDIEVVHRKDIAAVRDDWKEKAERESEEIYESHKQAAISEMMSGGPAFEEVGGGIFEIKGMQSELNNDAFFDVKFKPTDEKSYDGSDTNWMDLDEWGTIK